MHAFNFLKVNPDLRTAPPEVQQKGEKLLRIPSQRYVRTTGCKHSTYRQSGDIYALMRGDISDEEYQASKGHHNL